MMQSAADSLQVQSKAGKDRKWAWGCSGSQWDGTDREEPVYMAIHGPSVIHSVCMGGRVFL